MHPPPLPVNSGAFYGQRMKASIVKATSGSGEARSLNKENATNDC